MKTIDLSKNNFSSVQEYIWNLPNTQNLMLEFNVMLKNIFLGIYLMPWTLSYVGKRDKVVLIFNYLIIESLIILNDFIYFSDHIDKWL